MTHWKVRENQMAKLEKEYVPGKTDPDTFLKQVQQKSDRCEKNRKVREFTEQMDLSAQDNHMKYERASFSVVGEQTKSSNQKYAEGYERIDWTK